MTTTKNTPATAAFKGLLSQNPNGLRAMMCTFSGMLSITCHKADDDGLQELRCGTGFIGANENASLL